MRSGVLRALALVVVVAAALRVLASGFLPYDDALRHAAKAVSGRPWTEILIMRPGFTLDSNPGWHAILGSLHRAFGLGEVDLVLVSVALLFVVFSLGPILILRRPESWLLALVLVGVLDPGELVRLMCGRPFLVSSAIVPLVLLLWPRLEGPRPAAAFALFVAGGALSCWVHGSYYLLAIPVAALFAAGRHRAGLRLAAAFAVGIPLGALLTGHPLGHLWQMLRHGYISVGVHHSTEALVTEFQPFDGRAGAVLTFFALLAWRAVRHKDAVAPWRDPTAVMTAGCWALGYVAARFWADWSVPALLTLAAVEIQDLLETAPDRRSGLVAAAAASVLLLLSMPADVQQRWSLNAGRPFLSRSNPTHAPWLPEPGGIVYNADMGVFYALFFRNADAPWRYTLGFEPALMRAEDYAVYEDIRRSKGATEAYLPWLQRLRPQDRLYVQQRSNSAPLIPGLEWFQPVYTIWAGRLPRPGGRPTLMPPAVTQPTPPPSQSVRPQAAPAAAAGTGR